MHGFLLGFLLMIINPVTVAPGGGISAINVSGGTTSNNLSNLTFADGNGVSFGLNGSTLTASVAAGGGGLTAINLSAGTTSNNLSAVTFSNLNGISFGLDGSTLTGSIQTNYAGVGETVGTVAGTDLALTVNTDGVSILYPKWITTAALSGDTSKYAGVGESVGTVAGTDLALTVNTDGVSILYPKWLTTAQPVGAYLTTAALSQDSSKYAGVGESVGTVAGTDLALTVNTDGVSILYPKWLTTAALSGDTTKYLQNWKLTGNTAGTTSSAQGTDLWFSGGNSITVSGSSNTIVFSVGNYLTTAMASNRASDFVAATAAFAGTNASGTINSTGISVSVAAGGGVAASWFDNLGYIQGSTTLSVQGSTSHIAPFILPYDLSISYLRLMVSASIPGTTTIATTNGATGSCSIASTIFAVVYVQNTGASSQSLKSTASGSVGFTQRWSLSANATAGSQWTLSKTFSFQNTTGATSFTTQSVASTSNVNLASDDLTVMTGMKALDIPFATSLAAGNYWMMIGISSSTATGGSGTLTRLNLSVSNIGVSQTGLALGHWGNNTNASVHLMPGLGSFTTNAIGTTASLGYSNISTSAANNLPWWQFHRTT